MPSRGRKKLAARLWRVAEQQARKLELFLAGNYQRRDDRAADLQALRELTRILRELATFEDASLRTAARPPGGETLEHEQALAVERRARACRLEAA